MEDLFFEEELRRNRRERSEKHIRGREIYFRKENVVASRTMDVYQEFDDVLYEYYYRQFGESKPYEEVEALLADFRHQFTEDKLFRMCEEHEFTPEELDYIALVEASSKWRDFNGFGIGGEYAVVDIMLRKKIMEQFGEEGVKTILDILDNLPNQPRFNRTAKHFRQLLSSNKPYGENIHEELEAQLDNMADYAFNQVINCGGYSLKIDSCVFPFYVRNFSAAVSTVLDKFPFTRLLGDTPLQDDEYLVFYRAPEGQNKGHHFIRVDSDGVVREKDGASPKRIFESWGNLENYPEAVFAVKRDHKMFGYEDMEVNYSGEKGLDFEETVMKSLRERKNGFSYHGHEFRLKKTQGEEIYITTPDGKEVIADVLADEEECLIEIAEGKEDYVENFSGGIKPIIRNGVLVNYDEFKGRTRESDDESR